MMEKDLSPDRLTPQTAEHIAQRASRAIAAAPGPIGACWAAVKALSAVPHFNWTGIYLLEGDTLYLGPYVGEPTEHTAIPVGRGVCGRAVAEERDLNIPDVTREENYLACSIKTKSELVVLIRPGGEIFGQIDIDSHFPDAFGPVEEELVREVAVALERKLEQLGQPAIKEERK